MSYLKPFKSVVSAALCLLGVGVAPLASASLIASGNGLNDSATGLEWLSLNATQGQTYNNIMNGYGGFISSGWRYATDADVTTLFNDAGGDPAHYSGSYSYSNYAAAQLLVSLLGYTGDSSNESAVTLWGLGITGTTAYPGIVHNTAFYQFDQYTINHYPSNYPGGAYLFVGLNNFPDYYSTPSVASFLVRSVSPVPEPETYAMTLAGLGLLGMMARRRKQKETAAA